MVARRESSRLTPGVQTSLQVPSTAPNFTPDVSAGRFERQGWYMAHAWCASGPFEFPPKAAFRIGRRPFRISDVSERSLPSGVTVVTDPQRLSKPVMGDYDAVLRRCRGTT